MNAFNVQDKLLLTVDILLCYLW